MEKFLHQVELKNVSYERNKFRFQKTIKKASLSLFASSLIFISSNVLANSSANNMLKAGSAVNETSLKNYDLVDSSAVFTNRTTLKLDVKKPLTNFYTASIIPLKFSNQEDCDTYFNSLTDNLISFTVDFKAQTVLINLHLEYSKPEWTVADWNNYINSKLNP